MKTREFAKIIPAALAAALLLAGCDESDPVAPPDSTIILSASPTSLPSGGGTSDITAVVLDPSSIPLDGVAVFFSTNAGSLASQGIAQTTDEFGRAVDTLTTTDSAQIQAQSGDATAQVTITVAGQQLVGSITLVCQPTTGASGFTSDCTARVFNTNSVPIEGIFVTPTVLGDPNAQPSVGAAETDVNGAALFSILNLTVNGAQITCSVGSVSPTSPITITVTNP